MSDPSASPDKPWVSPAQWADAMRRVNYQPSAEQWEFFNRLYSPPPSLPQVVIDDQGVALNLEDTLHAREQALYSAAVSVELGSGQFPEDDAERIVTMAKRFERYIRSGQ